MRWPHHGNHRSVLVIYDDDDDTQETGARRLVVADEPDTGVLVYLFLGINKNGCWCLNMRNQV